MSQTAPPNRDVDTDRNPSETDATPESAQEASRDWKESVVAVTTTVKDAAVDAVAIVGDAARSLSARTRNDQKTDSQKTEPQKTEPQKTEPRKPGRGETERAHATRTPRRSDAIRNSRVVASAGATLKKLSSRTPPPVETPPPVDPADVAQAPTNGTATVAPVQDLQDLDDRQWRARPGTDTRERAWLPPLRERVEHERSWLMRAATFVLATLAGFAALIVIAVALLPRALALAADSAEAELILPENTEFDALASRSRVVYADGSLLAILRGEQDRNPVSLEKMPDHAWQAIVAEEDRKFFQHEGYDPTGIMRALVANFRAGGVTQGGSTISQQVARMNFEEVGVDESIERKLKEIVYAMAIERKFSKNEILDRYINQVYFGAGTYGFQAASEEFFDSNAAEITPDQAALLAGLISNPSSYNPRENPERAKQQRDLVLQKMANAGYLTQAEATENANKPLDIAPKEESKLKQPSIVEAIMREFKANPLFGATEQEREDNLFNGGLRIKTTINKRLQKLAENTVEDYYPDMPTAAIAAVNPRTGAVVAAASSGKYNNDKFSLALQGRRQPGSAFKPFVMAEALRQGYSPGTTLPGKSPVVIELAGEDWAPQNYGGQSYGNLDMRTATAKSVNTYYAQLIMLVGADKVSDLTEKMGINTGAAYADIINPAMVLGGVTNGITPAEMASAYGTFANNGVHAQAHLLAEVKRGKKDLLAQKPEKMKVLDPNVNAAAVDILTAPVSAGGTAPGVGVPNFPTIGKTGTTQNSTDAWFVGSTPVMATAVWVGYPTGQVAMPGYTGGQMASPLWTAFMTEALDGRDPKDWPEADDAEFVGKTVDVPDVQGLSEQEALAELAKAKLVGQAQYQPSPQPAGTVIWASPDDEAQIGTTIYVGVSNGEAPQDDEEDDDEDDDEGDGDNLRDQLEDLLQPGGPGDGNQGNGNGRGN
jgi:penicillin-binding protein 1A